jgi:hypothetical protein
MVVPKSFRQQVSNAKQDIFIIGHPCQKLVRSAPRTQLVCARDGFAMLLHLPGIE